MSNLIDRIRSGAGRAAFEAERLRRINAVQSEIKAFKEELSQAVYRIGNVAYELYREEQVSQPRLQEACQKVSALQERILAREREVESIRQEEYVGETAEPMYGRLCPQGHGPIPPENNFCQVCGARAIEVPPPAPAGNRFCQNCGQSLGPQARFCANCGAQAPEAQDEPETVYCQECGAALLPDAVFCSECGTPAASARPAPPTVAEDAAPPPGAREAVESPETKVLEADHAGTESVDEAPQTVFEAPAPADEEELERVATHGDAGASLSEPIEETASTEEHNVADVPAEAMTETDEDVQAAEGSDDDRACPACGSERLPEAVFCAECGYQFSSGGEAKTIVDGGPEKSVEVDNCPVCNASLLPDALFCAECGHQLAEA
jgi:predicted amidophosphoribosyltransferase